VRDRGIKVRYTSGRNLGGETNTGGNRKLLIYSRHQRASLINPERETRRLPEVDGKGEKVFTRSIKIAQFTDAIKIPFAGERQREGGELRLGGDRIKRNKETDIISTLASARDYRDLSAAALSREIRASDITPAERAPHRRLLSSDNKYIKVLLHRRADTPRFPSTTASGGLERIDEENGRERVAREARETIQELRK